MTNEMPLRADAQRNRDRILTAAEEVFVEKGAKVSLDEVAKRAGVGIGTLYRRFPTREDLLAAAYSSRFLKFSENSRIRATELDPLNALRTYLEELVEYANMYRGFAASLGIVLQIGTPGCIATSEEGTRLLENAQNSGVVRPDICFADIVCVVTAISLATEQDNSSDGHITRLIDIFMKGIATG